MDNERLLTTRDTAERLSVSARTVHRLVASGSLVPARFCGRLRFDPRDVEAFLERARGGGTASAAVEPAARSAASPGEEPASSGVRVPPLGDPAGVAR